MRIIISPAKKMNVDTDTLPFVGMPVLIDKTAELTEVLKRMSPEQLKKLWKCSDAIADVNIQRLEQMDIYSNLTPAIFSYEGIQYQYMAPGVFTDGEFDYIQEHLRILSGFYGVLKPFDGIVPYRLEMQAKLKIGNLKDLYSYWGSAVADKLFSETDCIVNLASKEYSICISKYLPESVRFITCVFGEEIDGKVIEKGTMCKMARGKMVRYMAENKITDPDKIKTFDLMGYKFDEARSDENQFVFVKKDGKASAV